MAIDGPTAVASLPRRVELGRTRRKVVIPPPAAIARFRVGLILIAADLAAIGMAFSARRPLHLHAYDLLAAWAVLTAPVLLATYVVGGYRLDAVLRTMPVKAMAAAAGVTFFASLALYKALFQDQAPSTEPVIVWTLVGIVAAPAYAAWVSASRLAVRALLARREASAALLHIGALAPAIALARGLRACAQRNRVLAFTLRDEDAAIEAAAAEEDIEVGRTDELDACLEGAIRAIVLSAAPQELPPRVLHDLVHARLLNIPIHPPSLLYEELWERTPVAMDDPSWLLQDERLHPARALAYQGAKRVIDAVVALIGLLALAPLMALVAIAVMLTSPGGALYSQRRVGLLKRPFTIYKFRTMRADAEVGGARWAAVEDPRVTPLGRLLRKTRIDELPQLWNVLVGDMSLVGPRPERPEFTDRLEHVVPYYDLRHLVKPGLTGWAQVRYPYGASVADALAKLEYDIYYIKRASMRFDLRILLRTLGIVVGLRGR